MVHQALAVAERLTGEGISVEVIDLRTLVPMDIDLVVDSVSRTHRLVVAHESVQRGRWGGEGDRRGVSPLLRSVRRSPAACRHGGVPIPFAAELEEQMIADERLLERRIRECLGLVAVEERAR